MLSHVSLQLLLTCTCEDVGFEAEWFLTEIFFQCLLSQASMLKSVLLNIFVETMIISSLSILSNWMHALLNKSIIIIIILSYQPKTSEQLSKIIDLKLLPRLVQMILFSIEISKVADVIYI